MNIQAPTQGPRRRPQQHPGPLCDRCRSIDFDTILSQQYPHSEIVPLISLERLPPGDCALCQLFAEYCGGDWGDAWLCLVSWERTVVENWDGWRSRPDDRMLSILPTCEIDDIGAFFRKRGYISEPVNTPSSWREGPAGPRSLDPNAIDYSMIQSWLDFYEDKHKDKQGDGGHCLPSKVGSKWPIRFIDCETRLVVEAGSLGSPCPPFLALSYVWGQVVGPQYHQPAPDEPLRDIPLTVRDSIIVTQKLGFRYLWVDKYCIRQDDEEDKRRQIQLMAEIYGSAQVTIVAVAGSDPTYGLPGVSRPRRIRQPHARVRNRTLTWAFGSSSLQDDVSSSVWSNRGWTYQEGILSARSLLFTDKQVYFQCGQSGFYEAFNVPFCLPGWTTMNKLFPNMKGMIYSWEIGQRIHEYTRRKLGNEADILNAFQGVLSAFAKALKVFNNVWGIPLIGRYDSERDEVRHPSHRFLASICWTLEMPGDRRHGFPSWSWAGWKGAVNASYANDGIRSIASNDTDIVVSFESHDGTRTEWSQLGPILGAGGDQDHLRILVLECSSFLLRTEDVHGEAVVDDAELTESHGSDARTSLRVAGDVTGQFYPLCKRPSWVSGQLRQGRLLGIPLGLRPVWKAKGGSSRVFILVVNRKTEFWERIGHIEWSNPEGPTDFGTFLNTVRTTRTVIRIA